MIGIILVSHSKKISDGIKDMISQMTGDKNIKIISAGGTSDGRFGTSSIKILKAIDNCSNCENILLFADIGSSKLSSETAISLIEDEKLAKKTILVDAPLIEGAYAAAVMGSTKAPINKILKEVKLAK